MFLKRSVQSLFLYICTKFPSKNFYFIFSLRQNNLRQKFRDIGSYFIKVSYFIVFYLFIFLNKKRKIFYNFVGIFWWNFLELFSEFFCIISEGVILQKKLSYKGFKIILQFFSNFHEILWYFNFHKNYEKSIRGILLDTLVLWPKIYPNWVFFGGKFVKNLEIKKFF